MSFVDMQRYTAISKHNVSRKANIFLEERLLTTRGYGDVVVINCFCLGLLRVAQGKTMFRETRRAAG